MIILKYVVGIQQFSVFRVFPLITVVRSLSVNVSTGADDGYFLLQIQQIVLVRCERYNGSLYSERQFYGTC